MMLFVLLFSSMAVSSETVEYEFVKEAEVQAEVQARAAQKTASLNKFIAGFQKIAADANAIFGGKLQVYKTNLSTNETVAADCQILIRKTKNDPNRVFNFGSVQISAKTLVKSKGAADHQIKLLGPRIKKAAEALEYVLGECAKFVDEANTALAKIPTSDDIDDLTPVQTLSVNLESLRSYISGVAIDPNDKRDVWERPLRGKPEIHCRRHWQRHPQVFLKRFLQ